MTIMKSFSIYTLTITIITDGTAEKLETLFFILLPFNSPDILMFSSSIYLFFLSSVDPYPSHTLPFQNPEDSFFLNVFMEQ